ncbi:MAG: multidrug effflux MFS transporter [Sphingomonadales bacterium]|nr:multidrug effflux MFS transporter [Sphingomonadales bacterium]MBD3774650.1 multidrug effflux MFS transporter [Paracoccaceae bacterium]
MAAAIASSTDHRAIGPVELVVLMAAMMALNGVAIDGMLPALAQLAGDLGEADGNRRQLVVGLYLLANGVGCIYPGILADRFGRRRVVLVALAAYVIGSLGCSLVGNFDELLAMRAFQGFAAAGLSVVPAAIIRDRYEGDAMARLLSMISAVFITVPIFAPGLGQLVLAFAGWRWIFVLLAGFALLVGSWVWLRLPETLDPQHRQKMQLGTLAGNMAQALGNRSAMGYVIGSAILFGSIFGYINMSQQLIAEFFGLGDWFPLVFGITAAAMVLANLTNSRIVTRFGARRVSHSGLIAFVIVSAAQVWLAYSPYETIWIFVPLLAINLALLGFLGANFGSIAMQPFARIAGAASSVQSFLRMVISSGLGIMIGQLYDGTARVLAIALLCSALISLALVLWAEDGKLFRRLHAKPPPQSADHLP